MRGHGACSGARAARREGWWGRATQGRCKPPSANAAGLRACAAGSVAVIRSGAALLHGAGTARRLCFSRRLCLLQLRLRLTTVVGGQTRRRDGGGAAAAAANGCCCGGGRGRRVGLLFSGGTQPLSVGVRDVRLQRLLQQQLQVRVRG